MSKRFQYALPEGLQFFEQCVEVTGISRFRRAALAFAAGEEQQVSLEPLLCKDGTTAVRVIGRFRGMWFQKRTEIGTLADEFARLLVKTDLLKEVIPQLRRIYVTDTKEVHVELDLIGSAAQVSTYRLARR